MSSTFEQFVTIYRERIDKKLPFFIEQMSSPGRLKEAMLYSVNAGGKRVRPLLMLAVIHAYRDIKESDYAAACALEMVHTYSLIHDDLPAMDDDDYRRGKPTNHKVFGEALAVLAGDALLTRAFGLMSGMEETPPEIIVQLTKELSEAAGAEGMVGGQVADLEGEGKDISLPELEYIHHHKTGALISSSIMTGSLLGSASTSDQKNLRTFASHLGLLFQIKDDILDVEGDSALMGKDAGSDEGKEKSTYPRLLTMSGAKEKLLYHADEARNALQAMSVNAKLLHQFIDYIVKRSH